MTAPDPSRTVGHRHPVTAATVGVVIPTYARPGLLAEALASVRGQTRPPEQVVVVNDDPDTHGEVHRACRRSACGLDVEVIDGRRGGVSAGRNAGASVLGTEFVAFLDDDDLWEPGFLAATLDAATRGPVDAVFSAAVTVSVSGEVIEVIRPRREEAFLASRARNPGVTGSTILVRRAVFNAVGGFDPQLFVSNDKDLAYRLASVARIATVDDPLVRIRQHTTGPRLTLEHRPRRLASLERYAAKHGVATDRRDRARMELSVLRERWHLQVSPVQRLAIAARGSVLVLRTGAFDAVLGRLPRRRSPDRST